MKQKNILLIMTDQQRYDTIEALGNPLIKTPALNSLVRHGVTFTKAYTPCPVCIPARYSMHTGLMPHHTNCVVNEVSPNNHRSFMEILRDNGYQTHGVGKMHFMMKDTPSTTMWGYESRDYCEGIEHDDYTDYLAANGYGHVQEHHGLRGDMYYIPQPSQVPEKHHNNTWVVDRSIDFLNRRDTQRPFMLMTSFIKPHPPFESPVPWNKLYRGPEMPLPKKPEGSEHLISYWNRFQNRYKYMDKGIDDNLIRVMKAAYYCSISFIDYNLGRLFDYMKENNIFDDTLIVFTADHGEMLGDYNCVGKRNFLDASARIPMIVVHPDLPKGSLCHKPVNLTDMLPTFLDAAGIRPEERYDGESMIGIANGTIDRTITYGQYQRDEYAMYMGVTEDLSISILHRTRRSGCSISGQIRRRLATRRTTRCTSASGR
jgi:arylsulfatase